MDEVPIFSACYLIVSNLYHKVIFALMKLCGIIGAIYGENRTYSS